MVGTADGLPVQEPNLRRALEDAKSTAKLESGQEERLSWHSLRHSFASMLASDLELPATTLARLTGHTDAGSRFVSTRAMRATSTRSWKDVLKRAAVAGLG